MTTYTWPCSTSFAEFDDPVYEAAHYFAEAMERASDVPLPSCLPLAEQAIGIYVDPPALTAPVRPSLDRALRDTAAKHPRCRCDLHASLTDDDLMAMGAGCTGPFFACPRLDAVRRRVV